VNFFFSVALRGESYLFHSYDALLEVSVRVWFSVPVIFSCFSHVDMRLAVRIMLPIYFTALVPSNYDTLLEVSVRVWFSVPVIFSAFSHVDMRLTVVNGSLPL